METLKEVGTMFEIKFPPDIEFQLFLEATQILKQHPKYSASEIYKIVFQNNKEFISKFFRTQEDRDAHINKIIDLYSHPNPGPEIKEDTLLKRIESDFPTTVHFAIKLRSENPSISDEELYKKTKKYHILNHRCSLISNLVERKKPLPEKVIDLLSKKYKITPELKTAINNYLNVENICKSFEENHKKLLIPCIDFESCGPVKILISSFLDGAIFSAYQIFKDKPSTPVLSNTDLINKLLKIEDEKKDTITELIKEVV